MRLTDEVRESIDRSVLCWLATVDGAGRPNVSPKETFAAWGDGHIAIANIASPNSARNVRGNPAVCVSFIDVFAQRGFKVRGDAREVQPGEADFAALTVPLEAITKGVFPIRGVILVEALEVSRIVAPSYHMVPGTTEQSQRASAMVTYGVAPAAPDD